MRIIVAVVVLVVVVGAALLVVGRPTVEATAASDPDVTVECSGATGVNATECGAWGDEILALDPPSTTFEMQDVSRLRIDRPLLGFGSPCQVQYFLQRYPDDSVWELDVPCR